MLFEFLYNSTKPTGYKFYKSPVFSLDEFLRFNSIDRPGVIREEVSFPTGPQQLNLIPYNESLTIDTTKFSKFNNLGYFLGGNNQNNGTLNMVESVDYQVDTAFYTSDTLVARNNSGCVGTDGTGYIVGGWNQNTIYSSIEKLSYSTNVSSLVPSTTLTEKVIHFASFLMSNDFILAGGITGASSSPSTNDTSKIYNIYESPNIISTSHTYRINLSTETLQSDVNLPSKRFGSVGIPQTNVTGLGFLIGGYSESLDFDNDFDSPAQRNGNSDFFNDSIKYMHEIIYYGLNLSSVPYKFAFVYLNEVGESTLRNYVDRVNNRYMNKIRKFGAEGLGRDNPLGLSGRYAVYIGSPDLEGKYSFDKFSITTTTLQFYQSFISSSIPLLYESIGNGNGSAGYIGGGHTRSYASPYNPGYNFIKTESSSIYKLDYITETSSTNSKLSLITARSKMGAFPAVTTDAGHVFANGETNLIPQQYVNTTSVSNNGYFVGGTFGSSNSITSIITRTTKINFSNTTVSTSPSSNLLHPRFYMASLSDSSFGYFCGGNGSLDPFLIHDNNTSSHFEKLSYSSDLILNDTNLVLSTKTQNAAGVGNLTSGYIVGGRFAPGPKFIPGVGAVLNDGSSNTTIQKINYKTSFCTSSFGNFATLANPRAISTGFGNLSAGYIAGGMNHTELLYGNSWYGTKFSSIEKINYASEVVSSLPSNLHTYKTHMSSVGNSTVSYLVGGTQWSISSWPGGIFDSGGGSFETIVEKFTYTTETLQSVPSLQSSTDYYRYRTGSSGCGNDTEGFIKSGSYSGSTIDVDPNTGSSSFIKITFSTDTKQGYDSGFDEISYTSAASARSNGFPTTGNVITLV